MNIKLYQHRDVKSENPTPATRVVCAAIKMPSGMILCGVRHCDEIMYEQNSRQPMFEGIQGFIDNRGNFLDRYEAMQLAESARQLIKKTPPEDRLFSEDIY